MSDLETSQNLTVLSQDPDTRQPEESSLLKLHTQPGTRKIFRLGAGETDIGTTSIEPSSRED